MQKFLTGAAKAVLILSVLYLGWLGTRIVGYLLWPVLAERVVSLSQEVPIRTAQSVDIVTLVAMFVVHELGHILAGNLVGMQLWSIAFGPVILEPGRIRRQSFRLAIVTQMGTRPNKPQPSRLQYAIYVAGGPLANLLVTACVVCIWQMTAAPSALLERGLLALGFNSVFVFLLSVTPLPWQRVSSDAASLLRLWRGQSLTAYGVR